jgi:hypothetical protein
MKLSFNQKIIIIGVVTVVILYLLYSQKEENLANIDNDNTDNIDNTSNSTYSNTINTINTMNTINTENTMNTDNSDLMMDNVYDQDLKKKMKGKNSAKDGEYKKISYSEGKRSGNIKSLDEFFDQGEPLNTNDNNNYLPNDIGSTFASYSGKPRTEISDEEKFNASALLPKEEKQDWFEDVTPQKIKNKHLINIYRPIGVNTVVTSHKNGSRDLRGNPVNPKTFVSPFLNSSIEPDINNGICTS